MAEETTPKRPQLPKFLLRWLVIVVVVAVCGAGGALFIAWQRPEILGLSKAVVGTKQEVDVLLTEVKKLIVLPDEQPTVATVSDVDKLRDQPFFASAQNGDKVLIFTNAKKAILYRPSAHLIIDVAPVNIGQSATPSGQAAGAVTETRVTVVLRNGTSVVGLTKRYEEELKQKAPQLVVVERENANKQSYTKSLLVDTKGTNASQASQLALTLGLSVAPIPPGEATSTADFLIILGSDRQ